MSRRRADRRFLVAGSLIESSVPDVRFRFERRRWLWEGVSVDDMVAHADYSTMADGFEYGDVCDNTQHQCR